MLGGASPNATWLGHVHLSRLYLIKFKTFRQCPLTVPLGKSESGGRFLLATGVEHGLNVSWNIRKQLFFGWTVIDFSVLGPPDGIKTHLCLFRLRLIFVVGSADAMNRCCTLALAFIHTLYFKMKFN